MAFDTMPGDSVLAVLRRGLLQVLPRGLAGRLRAWWLRRLVDRFRPYVSRHDFGGRSLQVFISDPLARGWYDHDWARLPEIEKLRTTRLVSGARVFDLGAHQGVVALMVAAEVGPTGQVVAVEPNSQNVRAAQRNRELNACSQLEIVEAAVADRGGQVVLTAGLNSRLDDGNGEFGRVTVPSVTLDELAARFGFPDVVFIDVEGAECLVLDGGNAVLESGADFSVEVHVGCGLERLGGAVERVLQSFPEERFALGIRAEGGERFRPIGQGQDGTPEPLFGDRFFLLAESRRNVLLPR